MSSYIIHTYLYYLFLVLDIEKTKFRLSIDNRYGKVQIDRHRMSITKESLGGMLRYYFSSLKLISIRLHTILSGHDYIAFNVCILECN